MTEILFKLKGEENFRSVEIDKNSLSHCTDTEELSIQLKEYIYNEIDEENGKYETFSEFEDDFDNFVFKRGDYWDNVVEPLFEELLYDDNDYDDEDEEEDGWFEERW